MREDSCARNCTDEADGAGVWVDFYESVDGPTLRIDVQEQDHLSALVNALRRLFDGSEASCRVQDIVPVACISRAEITMERHAGHGMMRKSIFRLEPRQGKEVFLWSTTQDGWYQNLGLIEGLEGPGHQYFGQDEGDDATIEIAYREPRPELGSSISDADG